MADFSKDGKNKLRRWLLDSYEAVQAFDGSEQSENKFMKPLSLFDAFVRAHRDDVHEDSQAETMMAKGAFPEYPNNMPTTVDGFLDLAATFYDRLKTASTKLNDTSIITMLEDGGAIVHQSDHVFVKTDQGHLQERTSFNARSYEVKTEPRLALLIEHLRQDGVDDKPIYINDLVITQGRVDDEMMRRHPYFIVQIPRLNMEIAVCDQIGETTFVKKGTVGKEFWDHLSKDQLKARVDVAHIDRRRDEQWWGEISAYLSGHAEPEAKKINVMSWSKKAPKLDMALIKESLLAHRMATGEWLSNGKKGTDGKSYILEHGPYAKQLTISAVENALRTEGSRGLPDSTTIAKLNEEISEEHGLDYVNVNNPDDLDMALIKESLLAHRMATGEWLSNGKKGTDGKKGSYMLEHGPYAGQLKVGALDAALRKDGARGLAGSTTIAKLNEEISEEHGLDYANHMNQDDLDMALIKESLLAHRMATGEWLSCGKKRENGKSYILEHGPYAGQLKVGALDAALCKDGARGLAGSTTIAKLNEEISEEHGLDYVNVHDQDDLDMALIKESLLAHRTATGEWLSNSKKGKDGKSYMLEHGPYAKQLTVSALNAVLSKDGSRGLAGSTSIAQLNEEISEEHGLDYANHMNQDDLDMALIKESLRAHRLATGEWLSNGKKRENGKSYILEHGPYAGRLTAGALDAALRKDGGRGLAGSTSIAQLNEEISEEHGLDYVNVHDQDDLDMALIKESLLAHRTATGEWLSNSKKGKDGKSYMLEHGPYAKQLTVSALNAVLSKDGSRGLAGSTSIAQLNEEISEEHGLDYVNVRNQDDLDMALIKESLLAHRMATGEWLSCGKKRENGKSYILEHGPYAGQLTVSAVEHALSRDGSRGLAGSTSIAQLNEEISNEHGLDYVNRLNQDDLDMALIKESLLAHRMATGEWLSNGKKRENGKSYMLEHGPYAGQLTVSAVEHALSRDGSRGLAGSTSIAQLNEEISEERGLDYVNVHDQNDLDMALIKQSFLAHRMATAEWLSSYKKEGENGKIGSYILEHGPYAGQLTVGALENALSKDGSRGLVGSTSIAQLNEEISEEHGLDYVNVRNQDDLDMALIKESLLAHRMATGEWLSCGKKRENGKSYILEHGPYAKQLTVSALDHALRTDGCRGLAGNTSIAKLNEEISEEHGLDYKKGARASHNAAQLIPGNF